MSKLDSTEAARIAALARLGLRPEALDQTAHDLSSILDFVDQLQAVDTTGVEETSQVTGLVDVLRDDKVVASKVPPAELLKRAPASIDGHFMVKRVLK